MSDQEESYIAENEVDEILDDAQAAPAAPSDDESGNEYDDEQVVEIDMSNNSSLYFDKHEDSIFVVATHPTLPMVVTGGCDNMAYLWTTHKRPPTLVETLSGHTESVVAAGFSADGQYLVSGDMDGQVRAWKSLKGGEKWQFIAAVKELDEVVWISFHPRLNLVAVGATEGSVWVYELGKTMMNIAVFPGNSSPATAGEFVDLGDEAPTTLVTLYEDGQVTALDVYQNQPLWVIGGVELRGNHTWVSVSGSPSGRTVAIGAVDGTVAIVKCEDGLVLQQFNVIDNLGLTQTEEGDRSVEGLAWSNPRFGLFAAGTVSGKVAIYSTANWRVRARIDLKDAVTSVKFAPETARIAASGLDGTMALYDALSGNMVWEGKGHNAGILGFATQNNFTRFITAGDEGVSLVFDAVEEPSATPITGGAAL